MKREQSGPFLSAVFVDYDNIYLSLRRKSEEAAKRFAKDAAAWSKQIESGALITPTNGQSLKTARRIVMNRCYGNPVPRRNTSDNSTDMSSFPFVRHHFLRAGFEVVDCPPLTAQLKNSSDIRMVMDLRDYLDHDTYFDEFVILSGDADFTPVLHRLRAHARRTVIYATDYTAAPYTAISDGEIREADLIALLLAGKSAGAELPAEAPVAAINTTGIEATRSAIIEDVVATVRAANAPVPLEVLADHAVRMIGHDRTIGTSWAGAGGFRELLAQGLPRGFRLSGEPPYVVIDEQRHIPFQAAAPTMPISQPRASIASEEAELRPERSRQLPDVDAFPRRGAGRGQSSGGTPLVPQKAPQATGIENAERLGERHAERIEDRHAEAPRHSAGGIAAPRRAAPIPDAPAARHAPAAQPDMAGSIHQSISRIHEACKAPPLAPPEYRVLFEIISQEINENGLIGAQTIQSITQRAQERGIDVRRDDVRFVLEVVSEADPWFEQGASPTLFAGRFRNFVVARCRAQGLNLSADELDLIEAWFAGAPSPQQAAARPAPQVPTFAAQPPQRPAPPRADPGYWSGEDLRPQPASEQRSNADAPVAADDSADFGDEDFPRIVRARLRS